jgi:hypothetical protein
VHSCAGLVIWAAEASSVRDGAAATAGEAAADEACPAAARAELEAAAETVVRQAARPMRAFMSELRQRSERPDKRTKIPKDDTRVEEARE